MVRSLLSIALSLALTAPVGAAASYIGPTLGVMEQVDCSRVSISVNQATVHITGGEGLTLEVVSLTGRRVAVVKIESDSQRVELNIPKGCYILKIGSVVRKVSIR